MYWKQEQYNQNMYSIEYSEYEENELYDDDYNMVIDHRLVWMSKYISYIQ